MKIRQVMKETGLSKRAVHHYIKSNLISPSTEQASGYYVFTQEDVKRLKVIRLLRALELSVRDIRNILDHPKTTNYYLTKMLKELNWQKHMLEWREECIESILGGISQKPSWEELCLHINKAPPPPDKGDFEKNLDAVDARMLLLYFLGNYTDNLEMTEYRYFLWNKLVRYVASPQNKQLASICRYLYSLGTEKIKETFSLRSRHVEYISSLTPGDYGEYIEYMANTIQIHIRDPIWVSNWKLSYEHYMLPCISFFDSPANELMKELSPRFSSYLDNIHACCLGLRQFLDTPEGQPLFLEINKALDGYMNLDSHHNGVLESIISFRKNMYQ